MKPTKLTQRTRRSPEAILPLEPRHLLTATFPTLPVALFNPALFGSLAQRAQLLIPNAHPASPAATPHTKRPTRLAKHSKPTHTTTAPSSPSSVSADASAASVTANPAPFLISGALAGKVIYTQGGHGYTYYGSPAKWQTQRPLETGLAAGLNGIVEDFGNEDQDTYFAHYMLQAGATVVPSRPVDHQSNESVIDNSTPYSPSTGGFQILSGTWTGDPVSTSSANAVESTYWSNNNGNDTYRAQYATTSTTGSAAARFTANIPAAGYYPVYAWAGYDANSTDLKNHTSNRAPDQAFIVNTPGGSYEVHVDLQMTGFGWIYLGNYYFNAGVNPATGSVDVSNKSSVAGKLAIADGIRFGNGMGDFVPTQPNAAPGPSGQPREEEAALYWDYDSRGWTAAGARIPTSTVDAGSTSSDDNTKDFGAPDRWAAYMNNSAIGTMNDRLWISFHSNATNGTGTRGTLGLINTVPTKNQASLALLAGSTVQNELAQLPTEYPWSINSPPTYTGGYSEISNNVINGEFDATIIEVAYHDQYQDVSLLEDPKVRDAVGRAAYHTAVQYFQTYDSLATTTYLPEPATDIRTVTNADGTVTVSWTPGPSSSGATSARTGPYGDAATSYLVETSTTGIGFDGGVATTGTSATFTGLSATAPTYFRVVAVNPGGQSEPSPVAAAKPQAGATHAPILVVNNFTRLDRQGDRLETNTNLDPAASGTFARVDSLYNNAQNYVVQAASSISAYNPGLGIDSAPASAVASGAVNLANYQAVIWMSGEQSSADLTFTPAAQTAVTNYLSAGGKLLVSGANVAFDLAAAGGNHGATFLSSTLHATYVRDDTNTHSFSAGASGSAFAGVPAGSFDDGTHGTYDVDAPDGLSPAAGATAALSYSGGTGGTAAVQYASGNQRLILLAFPLESVYTTSTRNALVAGALNYFGLSSNSTPAPGTPDLAAAFDRGPSNSDNVTNLNNSPGKTLQFAVPNTVPGALVQLFADGTLIGQTTATTTSTLIATNGTYTLTDAAHSITAVQTNPGQATSLPSAALAVTIDTTAPAAALSAASGPPAAPAPSATLAFSEPVYNVVPSDLALARDGSPIPLTAAQTLTAAGNAYTLTSLAPLDGRAGTYTLAFNPSASGVTDLAGNPATTPAGPLTWSLRTVLGTPGDDTITLARDPSNPAAVDVTVNGSSYAVTLTHLGSLTVQGGAGDDTLLVDDSNGQPAFDPGASLTFAGGDATTHDSLLLLGTPGDDTATVTGSSVILNAGPATYYSSTAPSPVAVSFAGSAGHDTLYALGTTLTFPSDASVATPDLTLDLGFGASANFQSAQHLAALNLTDNASATLAAGGNKVLVTGALSLAGTSKLDLADNDLVLDLPDSSGVAGATTQIRQYLLAGSLFSSTAASNPQHATALGYGDSASLGLSTFSNQPVDASALLVKYTYNGDTDLDGRVTADDLARIDFGRAASRSTWLWGDSNYNGAVDAADVSLAQSAFANQGPAL